MEKEKRKKKKEKKRIWWALSCNIAGPFFTYYFSLTHTHTHKALKSLFIFLSHILKLRSQRNKGFLNFPAKK